MKKNIRYDQSTSKKINGLAWWKGLRDENFKMIYLEYNHYKEIRFYI